MHIRNPETNEWEEVFLPPTGDTLPTESIVEFDGDVVPTGWEEVEEEEKDDPNDYSTDERVVGTWEGKPLYRKIIYVTDFTPDTYHRVPIIPNCKIKKYSAYITRDSGKSVDKFVGTSLVTSIRQDQIEYKISDIFVNIETCYFIVEYTKTTDEEV